MSNTYSKRGSLLWTLLCFALLVQAQIPQGYYADAKGQSGRSLKTALFQIVKDHTTRSYDNLWDDFKKTDVRADGKIWDMYSNSTNFTPGGSEQGKNYSKEGDAYNREHSFPKSWFNDARPMYTDLFHLYPTDGYVNNRRSNYPFGETDGERYQSNGGFSKLGKCTVSGYSGIVFEPADEYKGDFARTYFYMATAYEDKIASWSSDMLAGNSYPAYADWALTMLLRWAQEDPVSEKETARNEAVYKIQHNRNPYIDYPGLEQYVWGAKSTTAFDPDNYDGGTVDPTPDPEPEPTEVAAPVFSPASGVVAKGTAVSISTTTAGAYIYYTVNDGDLQVQYPPVTLTIDEATSISAYAQRGEEKSETVTATYTLQGEAPAGDNVYALVTDEAALTAGTPLLVVSTPSAVAMGTTGKDIRNAVSVTISPENTVTTEVNQDELPYAFVLGGQPDAWTLYDGVQNVYLALTSSANKLHTASSAAEKSAQWHISISADGTASLSNAEYTDRFIQYNVSSPRFACYKSTSRQQDVSLFALMKKTAISEIEKDASGLVRVYDLNGRHVRSAASAAEALRQLPAGLYIVNGKKILVR